MIGNTSKDFSQRDRLASDSIKREANVDEAIARAGETIRRIVGQMSESWETTAPVVGNPAVASPTNATDAPLVSLPPSATTIPAQATLHPLQEWEGHVVEIQEDEFVARLIDLTAGNAYESQEAAIPLAEISERDTSRMAIGSIFRWVIGYRTSPGGTRTRVSQIVFRDLPRATANDLREGTRWANAVAATLNP